MIWALSKMAKMASKTAFVWQACLISVICAVCVASDGVPVMIWSNKELEHLPDVAIGHTTPSDTFYREYLTKLTQDEPHSLVVFLQDRLSVDDITQHADVFNEESDGAAFHNLKYLLENSASSQLPSVSSPAAAISKLQQTYKGQVHQLSAPYALDELLLDGSSSHLILVDLPQTESTSERFHDSLKHIDGILSSVSVELNKRGISYTAVYTAEKATRAHQEAKYLGRHLLADSGETNDTLYTLFNVTNSTGAEWLVFYARNITVELCDTSPDDPEKACSDRVEVHASDFNSSFKDSTVTVEVDYGSVTGFENLKFYMDFTGNDGRRFWYFTNFTVDFKAADADATQTQVLLVTDDIMAAYKQSYHCSRQGKLYEHSPTKDRKTVNVYMFGFQVQYGFFESGQFGLPNDCVGFFTIGVLSGLTVTLLLILILAYGMAMIMNISTMDRFDDPKGKTIMVAAQE